jgi:hypothetical protein
MDTTLERIATALERIADLIADATISDRLDILTRHDVALSDDLLRRQHDRDATSTGDLGQD